MAKSVTASSGEVARVQLYADVEHIEGFSEFHKRLGMSQREAASRLFAWYNRQSPLIRQQIIQPLLPEIAPDVARIILERMTEQDRLKKQQEASEENAQDQSASAAPSSQENTSLTVYGDSR
ncbi:MAG: hypothetical protein AAF333_08360 [Planctomycetota bacterium]